MDLLKLAIIFLTVTNTCFASIPLVVNTWNFNNATKTG